MEKSLMETLQNGRVYSSDTYLSVSGHIADLKTIQNFINVLGGTVRLFVGTYPAPLQEDYFFLTYNWHSVELGIAIDLYHDYKSIDELEVQRKAFGGNEAHFSKLSTVTLIDNAYLVLSEF